MWNLRRSGACELLDGSLRMYVEFEYFFYQEISGLLLFNGLTFLYRIHPMSLKKLYCFQGKKNKKSHFQTVVITCPHSAFCFN